MQKPKYICGRDSEHEKVMQLVEFAAWCCASQGNQANTISGKLGAVRYFHTVDVGVELPKESLLLKRQLDGMRRAHVLLGDSRELRLPITMHELLLVPAHTYARWGSGGRVLGLCMMLAFFIGARAHEIFKDDTGRIHPVNCLIRNDIVFFAGELQLPLARAREATKVEIRFRGHKGDQEQAGTVLVRTRKAAFGPFSRLDSDGGAVAVLVELMTSHECLSGNAPLSAFRDKGRIRVWSYREATRAIRQVAGIAGLDPKRVSLHSLRIGYATVLAAGGGISERVIQREGRWKSGIDTYKVYTRSNIEDSVAVSRKLASASKEKLLQPGQGTRWNR